MTVKFCLPIKPFSINRMSYRDQRFRTQEYQLWATTALAHMREMPECEELMKLKDAFNPKRSFYVQIINYYPGYLFFNAKGEISAKTIDMSNSAKPLIDLLFGDILDINDRYITRLDEHKRAGESQLIEITLILN